MWYLIAYHFPTFNEWLILKICFLLVVILRYRKGENNHLEYLYEISVPFPQDPLWAQTSYEGSFGWKFFETFLGVLYYYTAHLFVKFPWAER